MRYPTLSVLVVSASMSLISSPSLHAADPDTQGVHAALAAYHQALNKVFTGDAAPMKTLWSHADDVTYMGPAGGMLHGWPQIEQYWDRQAAKKLVGKVDPEKVHVFAGQTLAVVCYHAHGEHVFDGKPQPVSIRATTTFRKEDGQWKVIGHHTDTLAEYLKK